MIIGISGKSGSGKDTIGKIIQYLTYTKNDRMSFSTFCLFEERWYNGDDWQIKKFAYKLKQIASILTGIPIEKFENQEFKNTFLGKEWTRKIYFEENGIKMKPTTTHKVEERPLKIRELLQLCGTEAIRNSIHKNAWVNALFSEYVDTRTDKVNGYSTYKWRAEYKDGKFYVPYHAAIPSEYHGKEVNYPEFSWIIERKEKKYPNWIITDVRFPNEVKAIKDRGGIIIRVERPVENYSENFKFNGDMQSAVKIAHNHPSETALDNAEFDYIIDNNGTIEELIKKVKEILIKEQIIK